MKNIIELKSGSTSLQLGPIKNEYIQAKFESNGVQASLSSYLYTDSEDYYQFFKGLSDNWKGWDGQREWETVEGDLKLKASNDSKGHVSLSVDLIKDLGTENEWCLNGKVKLELGQLKDLADKVKSSLV